MIEVILVLTLPLAGAVVLALIGERDYAPDVNVIASLCTLVAAAALTGHVISAVPVISVPVSSQWHSDLSVFGLRRT